MSKIPSLTLRNSPYGQGDRHIIKEGKGRGRKKRALIKVAREYTVRDLTQTWKFKLGRLPGGGNALLETGK